MKWFAVGLLLLNIVVWQVGNIIPMGEPSGAFASGNLPRVTSLRVQAEFDGLNQPAPAERSCVRVGWLQSFEGAKALSEHRAFNQVSGMSIDEVKRPLPSLHWVIVPPQPPGVALEQFRNMQRQGIESYLVMEGENKNAISLGLFESRNAAISVLEEKKRKKFNVVLVNFDRNQISYALSFEAEPDLVEEMVQAVEADFGSEFDFVEVNRCEGVATSEKTP
ncbi:hypothetical protein [Marinobacter salexigens]|uniref:hypothetical protein n=1 Tax=Marinobacter salexigens TaxID=1925763 RepID=UPI000C2841B0|nr:hypothetical protein [Marinobacter salexigens]